MAVHVSLAPKVNYASMHNAVPVLRELCVENISPQPLEALAVQLRSEPPVLVSKRWFIDRLGPGERLYIDDRDVVVDAGFLWELTEAVTTRVEVVVTSNGQKLAVASTPIEVLARNEWGGVDSMPELIAAFVTPNDPGVERVLKTASILLRDRGLSPALDGYQSGSPRRAAEIAAAIWAAVGQLGLDYSAPPASFERQGQKVRTPSHIVEAGLGTCLDLTLFFAACLEQAGMNPLIVFLRGHALVGCWLQEEHFAGVVVDDPAALRNRIRLGELLIFETTLATQRPLPAFSAAVDAGEKLIAPENDARFECVIDVRCARMQRIRPLPSQRPDAKDADGVRPEREDSDADRASRAVDIPEIPIKPPVRELDVSEAGLQSRFERWQRKLLDLSLRNRLLNFRPGRNAVFLHSPDPERLEDLLADGAKLTIRPLPPLVGDDTGRSEELHRQRYHEDLKDAYAREGLERKEVYVDLPPEELEVRLVELYRKARTGLEEGGANVLYLAMGFLTWRKSESKGEQAYRAPLILVPVRLERSSVRAPMKLVRHDDESQVNPTLLQMLEQDFRLVIPELQGKPLEDEAGLDVRAIWNVVRQKVKEFQGWEVTEEVALTTFSFAKFLMWKDLVARADQLKQNPVVRHLLETPRDPYPPKGTIPDVSTLDSEYLPNQTFTILPADSSQLAATMAVAKGIDLIIEGPPGTGKSQTIANIIAQCLADGRTVLFVSEKRAALDVVYRRLKDVGLGDFCLELHSNKARKADVVEQLRRAWDSRGELNQEEWVHEATRLGRLRDSLNQFVRDLHTVHANGLTPFMAMGEVVRGQDVPRIPLRWSTPDAHDRVSLDQLRELVDRIRTVGLELKTIADHPLRAITRSRWSTQWQSDLLAVAETARQDVKSVAAALEAFLQASALPACGRDRHTITALVDLADVLVRAREGRYGFVLSDNAPEVIAALRNAANLLEARRAEVAGLSCRYSEQALASLETDELNRLWQQSATAWWPQRWMLRRQVLNALRQAVAEGGKPDAGNDLPRLKKIKAVDATLGHMESLLRQLGALWKGLETDVASLHETVHYAERLQAALARLYPSSEVVSSARERVRTLLERAGDLLSLNSAVGRAADALVGAWRALDESLKQLCDLAGTDVEALCPGNSANWLSALEETLAAWASQAGKLRLWCMWRELREKACEHGLEPLVNAIEAGVVLPEDSRRVFDVNYCRWWVSAIVERTESLRTFVAAEHEYRIEEFRRLDDRFAQMTREYIRAKICSGIPSKDDVSRGSEWGVLSRELAKKRRHKPVRQLVSEIPTVLTKLTPCLLMSPLSIAQYLPPGQIMFDVVIFDEASQIPVWDAIGAIARGRQTVIVGDSKQLPPTNFFERAEQDDEFAEDIEEDLESILDECRAAGLPTLSLKWHYRSRHESLIAFSNHWFYNDSLITFPSPVTDDKAVRFHYVPDGIYELGGARVNRPEARALVAEVVRRMRDPIVQQQRLSIGIVTFNAEQQRLIEDLLDNERRADPSLEPWFAEDANEPLMVKNLENVQGDERDIIYFSVTFGPDQTRRISMNFGPLNREGGERRLNVAITRARREMHIFSSLRAEQIDLSRTQSEGVKLLKRFLEYAEHGVRAFAAMGPISVGGIESPFEAAVASALRRRGWEVHTQVGVSAYRIDLGVVDPDAPGRYLAGVECDGATYHRSATARDRDKLREAVLRGLGWEIIRVWSTDWWSDPDGALERLDRRLRVLLEQARQARSRRDVSDEPAQRSGPPEQAEPVGRVVEVAFSSGVLKELASGQPLKPHQRPVDAPLGGLFKSFAVSPEPSGMAAALPQTQPRKYTLAVYTEADLRDIVGNPERFFESDYTSTLRLLIDSVIQQEGPIRDELLVRRIARVHGFQRAGSRIRDRILAVARRHAVMTREDVGTFFWPSKEAQATWSVFRQPPPGDARMVEDIPMEELRALYGLVTEMGLSGEDALRRMAAMCGINRLGSNVRSRLERVLRHG